MGKGSGNGGSAGVRWSRRWRRLGLLSVIGLLAVVVPATTSSAIDGVFESDDGDLESQTDTDWNDFETSTPTGFTAITDIPDAIGNPDDIFNGGVKQDAQCPGTKIGSLGGGGSKFDVERLYLTHTEDTEGDDYLFLAWVRVPQNSTTASSHIAFEFNSGTVTCTTNENELNPDLVERSAGDKLIVYDFEGGASEPTLKLATWVLNNDADPCEVASNVAPCWAVESLSGDVWDAAVNTGGSVEDEVADPNETLGTVEFGEAGINLTEAVGEENVCAFSGHVTGVARSSGSSGTAQMKDKIGPAEFELPGCVANTDIVTNISLDDHATITGMNSQGEGNGLGDLTFALYGPDDFDCSGTAVYTTTISNVETGGYVDAQDSANNRPWSTADGDNPLKSYPVPTDKPGEYNWVVHYSGDEGPNPAADSECGYETAVVTYDGPDEPAP